MAHSQDPTQAMSDLLTQLFSTEELRREASYGPDGGTIRSALPAGTASTVQLADAIAAAWWSRRIVEPVFTLLRLLFVACHPVLSREGRVALTLRLLGGLSTAEIGRAFLLSEATVAQRIVRAKRALSEARVPFEVPGGRDRQARLSSVLEVIYLVFNEGYAATSGEDWLRPALCEEALRLGRVLSGLCPEEPEVWGLLALMELQASRNRARVGPAGEPILLGDQDRSRWDGLLLRRGLDALDRALALRAGGGPMVVQAAIAACHARPRRAQDTDWGLISALYERLYELYPSPVVRLNQAVAVAMVEGPAVGLRMVEELEAAGVLRSYHLLPAVKADILLRLGRRAEAREELVRAAGLATNRVERGLLERRAAGID